MSAAAELRNASHLLAHVSGMLRKPGAPAAKDWDYLRSLFSADAAFEVSNRLIDWAQKVEAREQAA